ncbi:MAG TPA: heterodisulfide reductase-related iron-sulfur binding cluster [Pyrinomonadaceae bacterium]|nr:heterodisulfide reductase-related iron-sulfur binding cluster [Pyrinomonadaceae bacterium]
MQTTPSQSTLTSTLQRDEEKLLACIHCGLCLEACPTYVITGDENDGPRGRLYLMRAVGEGRLASDSPAFERHIDRCLGCRACEQVCPAGVEYGQLLEAARGELFQSGPKRGFSYAVVRLVLKHVWLHPARLKFAFAAARVFRDTGLPGAMRKSGLAKLLSRQLQFAMALLESSRPKIKTERGNAELKNAATKSRTVNSTDTMLFTGCVGEGLFSRVNRATARVLQVNGFTVQTPPAQVCCGALHAHAGDLEGARRLARRNLAAFEGEMHHQTAPIITNAGGCGAMLASYTHLLSQDAAFAERAHSFSARVRDVSQQLETVEMNSAAGATDQSVTYDSSCHLLYGQHAGEAPLKMLDAVAKLNFVKLEESERCCGGAGIYNLLEPDLSAQVLAEKLANIQATQAQVLATGNPGCQMQIGAGALLAGMDLEVCHPVELLDEAYAQAGMYEEGGSDE